MSRLLVLLVITLSPTLANAAPFRVITDAHKTDLTLALEQAIADRAQAAADLHAVIVATNQGAK